MTVIIKVDHDTHEAEEPEADATLRKTNDLRRLKLKGAVTREDFKEALQLLEELKYCSAGHWWSNLTPPQSASMLLPDPLYHNYIRAMYNNKHFKINGQYVCGVEKRESMVNITALRCLFLDHHDINSWNEAFPSNKALYEHPAANGDIRFFSATEPSRLWTKQLKLYC
jgi:hypothetical protein